MNPTMTVSSANWASNMVMDKIVSLSAVMGDAVMENLLPALSLHPELLIESLGDNLCSPFGFMDVVTINDHVKLIR